MVKAGVRNKVMKLLDRKGYDSNIIEDVALYIVEIGNYQNYGELLMNSIESYSLRDKMVFIMRDLVCVEQAIEIDANMG
jgi:hypothetical protein